MVSSGVIITSKEVIGHPRHATSLWLVALGSNGGGTGEAGKKDDRGAWGLQRRKP